MSTVLIVEDDSSISELIAINLEVAGYKVIEAYDGKSALDALGQDIDLAVLDILLPGMDGFELLGHMKVHQIPVIFLTAKNELQDKVRGLKDGAEDYIVKPFEVLELLVRIEKVLERHHKTQEVFTANNLEINTATRIAKLDGKAIPLKPMEFGLLLMLVKNKNIALSREKLLYTVWGENFLGESRTVDVHISQLRKKLGWSDVIKTVPKIGYRLETTP